MREDRVVNSNLEESGCTYEGERVITISGTGRSRIIQLNKHLYREEPEEKDPQPTNLWLFLTHSFSQSSWRWPTAFMFPKQFFFFPSQLLWLCWTLSHAAWHAFSPLSQVRYKLFQNVAQGCFLYIPLSCMTGLPFCHKAQNCLVY